MRFCLFALFVRRFVLPFILPSTFSSFLPRKKKKSGRKQTKMSHKKHSRTSALLLLFFSPFLGYVTQQTGNGKREERKTPHDRSLSFPCKRLSDLSFPSVFFIIILISPLPLSFFDIPFISFSLLFSFLSLYISSIEGPPPSPFDGGGRKDARLRTIFFSLEVFFLSPCSSSLSFFLDLDHFFSRDCVAALSRSVFLFFLFIFIAESRSVDDGNVKAWGCGQNKCREASKGKPWAK